MDYFLGASLGGLIAFVFAIPAIVFEFADIEVEKPLVMEVKTIAGKILKRSEVFLAGLLLHLLIGTLFGIVYVLFVDRGWLFVTHRPYTMISFFVYGVLSWIVMGFVIYPLLRMGLFGRLEGKHVWMETLASHLILAFVMAALVHWFQPWFFVGSG